MVSIFIIIKNFLKYLNSKESVENIALSFTIAYIFTLIPFNFIVHPILLFLLIILNGNILIFIFLAPLFSFISNPFVIHLHNLGTTALTSTKLLNVFVFLSSIPLLNYTNWNNTLSMGAYIISIITAAPFYFVIKKILTSYRLNILPKIKNSKFLAIFKIPKWIKYIIGQS